MHPQYLIIGQGIAGTLLSYALWKQGRSFIVIDEPHALPKASLVAGAVINPVNVNRWTMVASHQYYISAALKTYSSMEETLGMALMEAMPMLVFHKDETKRRLYNEQQLLLPAYIQQPAGADVTLAQHFFSNKYGMGKVNRVWKIHAAQLLSAWSHFLKSKGLLIQEHFNIAECRLSAQGIQYKAIGAEKIIFCEGAAAINNPFFTTLPFTKNRGEALLLSVPGLPATYIYHYGIRLVPAGEGLFWCGSNYRWQFNNLLPDENWRMQTEATLRQWLSLPFEVVDHVVAERPTTEGQQFLTGTHPAIPSVAIFNGLGTKGFSCGPALAQTLCKQLTDPDHAAASTAIPLSRWIK
ncbi:FAD-dependent oxidoreductase [Agriterribacter sp.]|uniref:NAD(P)/FAD-dependent oxidoreductase n=1 Tax=Agriterribacter sp. TaxID=2821509 RepID=UPI002C722690|nr:FAD-dependent oxidoreductase [Agriterribacter sp.]HRO48070.1 FAD-dependent oxidoreductase [Agriterribacter sp.]HRQ16112.1 FAD-dependent oxidoreductase [Agriterribacter sp.]